MVATYLRTTYLHTIKYQIGIHFEVNLDVIVLNNFQHNDLYSIII